MLKYDVKDFTHKDKFHYKSFNLPQSSMMAYDKNFVVIDSTKLVLSILHPFRMIESDKDWQNLKDFKTSGIFNILTADLTPLFVIDNILHKKFLVPFFENTYYYHNDVLYNIQAGSKVLNTINLKSNKIISFDLNIHNFQITSYNLTQQSDFLKLQNELMQSHSQNRIIGMINSDVVILNINPINGILKNSVLFINSTNGSLSKTIPTELSTPFIYQNKLYGFDQSGKHVTIQEIRVN